MDAACVCISSNALRVKDAPRSDASASARIEYVVEMTLLIASM